MNQLPESDQTIDLRQTQFLSSAPNLKVSPPDKGIEIAFVGRSNSGKSSALNAILGRNSMARTSKTPGRTQLINYFEVDEQRRLVDLPGYGFAKVPQRIKQQIEFLLSDYLENRQCLFGLILLMDIRHPLTNFDKELIDFVADRGCPIHILLTKSDKIKRGPANATLLNVKKNLSVYQGKISVQTFSALKKFGVEQANDLVCQWLNSYE